MAVTIRKFEKIQVYYLQDLQIIPHTRDHTRRSQGGVRGRERGGFRERERERGGRRRERDQAWGFAFIQVKGEGLEFVGSLLIGVFKT